MPSKSKKKSGSNDSPKRTKLRRRIQAEEAKPEAEQDEELLEELYEEEKAPLTDTVIEYGTETAKKFDRATLKICGGGCCTRYFIRLPAFFFFAFFWPLLINKFYIAYLAHPKAFYCIFENILLFVWPTCPGPTLKFIQRIFSFIALFQNLDDIKASYTC